MTPEQVAQEIVDRCANGPVAGLVREIARIVAERDAVQRDNTAMILEIGALRAKLQQLDKLGNGLRAALGQAEARARHLELVVTNASDILENWWARWGHVSSATMKELADSMRTALSENSDSLTREP